MRHKLGTAKLPVDWNLAMIFGVTLTAVMGVTSLAPAFPKITQVFGLTEWQVGWLITAFTLPGVVLTPILGVVADRLGRKWVLVPSLLLFGIAGGLCAFAPNFQWVVFLRVWQGIGAAALGSINVTILGDLYQGPARARAMGLNASVLSIGTACYPILGGALAVASWNYPFLLPWLAIPLAVVVARFMRNPEPAGQNDLRQYLQSAWLGLKNRKVLGIFLVGIITFIVLYGCYLTYLSQLLGREYQASSFAIGVIMFSMSFTTAMVSAQLGKLTRRFAKRNLAIFAFCAYVVALAIIPFVGRLELFVIPTLVFGVGHGLNIPSLQTMLAEQAPLEYRAIFMSLNGMMLRIGQTLGPLLMGLVFVYGHFQAVFWVGSLLAVVGALVVGLFLRDSVPQGAGGKG
ncbi:MAG TPA: MFS transporter [Firmicutes bacterium]|nr:MFS transporter [Bacillota bacterium]